MDSDDEKQNLHTYQNQPYDESLDVGDQEEVASLYDPTPRVPRPTYGGQPSRGNTPPQADSRMSEQSDDDFASPPHPGGHGQQPMYGGDGDGGESEEEDEDDSEDDIQTGSGNPGVGMVRDERIDPTAAQKASKGEEEDEEDDEDDEDDDEDDEDDDEEGSGQVEGAYDPADYEHLAVTPEIKELFGYITRYTPQTIDLDYKLKPFIPDYIPSVGDIDAFIKIPRPDHKGETLGLTVLDEPCAKQSDPTVLDLQLRAFSKQTTAKQVAVKSIDDADKNTKAINNWIASINDLHRNRPPPNVHYTKNMPDVDSLMQEWPAEFEELLKEVGLPTAETDCDLPTYIDMVCAILDIPVFKSRIQSLHVLFTLYSEFKNSQHFRGLAESNQLDNNLKHDQGGGGGEAPDDKLVL